MYVHVWQRFCVKWLTDFDGSFECCDVTSLLLPYLFRDKDVRPWSLFEPPTPSTVSSGDSRKGRVKMPFGIGELPKEYNLKVHGPYDPAVYYGPSKLSLFGTHDLSTSRSLS